MIAADARETDIRDFLQRAGWGHAVREPLPGDASTRRYERLRDGTAIAMLMDAPGKGEDPPCPPDADERLRRALGWNATSRLAASRVDAFAAIARHLKSLGLSAPDILALDAARGLAIVEDLGPALFATELARGSASETTLYAAAGALLGAVQSAPVPATLPADEAGAEWPILPFDRLAIEANTDLFFEWWPRYLGKPAPSDADSARWAEARDALTADILSQPQALTLRDYHAENLIWLPDRAGLARVGLLDFQDAVIGPAAWDMSMLLHDARRDVSPDGHNAAVQTYLDATGRTEADFNRDLAASGLANTLRILGIFARLVHRDGKPRYERFMPREWGHLARILETPGLGQYSHMVDMVVPDWRERTA